MKNDIMLKMLDTTVLEGKAKKQWTAVFVCAIVLFSICCLEILNVKYDSLARYPYEDENSRKLIRQYLSEEEIEYIIEYSIPPNMFIAYIQEDGFSIYHAAEYKKLSESQWDKSPAMIVKMVEETRNLMTTDQLASYLAPGNYKYEDIQYYIQNEMDEDCSLIAYAMNTDAYPDAAHTLSTRKPSLQYLSEEIPTKDGAILEVNEALQQPLLSLCGGITSTLSDAHACGGLQIETGYVSHTKQKRAYEEAMESYGEKAGLYVSKPGHDEHQLGLAVDFSVEGLSDEEFEKTIQYQWLKENAWKYGFMETWNVDDEALTEHQAEPYHYRYIGTDLAKTIHDSGLSFARYKAQIK